MKYSWLAVLLGVLSLPFLTLAQEYQPIVGIPGIEGSGDLSQYMNAVYRLAITIAALLAVLIIIKGGVKHMFSDIVTDKSSAKSDIRGAILGLLLILSGVLILSTVNEDLTDFKILITPIEPPPAGNGGGGTRPPTIDELCDDAGQCGEYNCLRDISSNIETCISDCQQAGGIFSRAPVAKCTVNRVTCQINGSEVCCLANVGDWMGDDRVSPYNICRTPNQVFNDLRCEEDRSGGMDQYTYDCQQATQECRSVQFGNVVATNEGGSRILCDTTPSVVAENLQEFADDNCPDGAIGCTAQLGLRQSVCEGSTPPGRYFEDNGGVCVFPPAQPDEDQVVANRILNTFQTQGINPILITNPDVIGQIQTELGVSAVINVFAKPSDAGENERFQSILDNICRSVYYDHTEITISGNNYLACFRL